MATTYNTRYPVAKCARCFGDGYFERWGHIANGVCFLCGGTKYKLNPKGRGLRKRVENGNAEVPQPHSVEPSIYCDCPHCEERPERTAQREIEWSQTAERSRKRSDKLQAAGEAKRTAWEQANPDQANLLASLLDMDDEDEFARSLNRGIRDFGSLTEKQAASLPGSVERTRNFIAAAIDAGETPDVPEGKQAIKGEVVSIKWHDHAFGSTMKMVVKVEQGWAVWGSVPDAIAIEVEVGDTVTFTAGVTRSDRDPKFGFFKRPTKAAIIG
jgi:hypothetical protein